MPWENHVYFAGQGITESIHTVNNDEGMEKVLAIAEKRDFDGFCFVNLVDFDMIYGHRNDVDGYAVAISAFDRQLRKLLPLLHGDDLLMITADHGCDPGTKSTDHSREYVPLILTGPVVQPYQSRHEGDLCRYWKNSAPRAED